MVYNHDREKFQKHRLVKFEHEVNVGKQTQTVETKQNSNREDWMRHPGDDKYKQEVHENTEKSQDSDDFDSRDSIETNNASTGVRYPVRERRKPSH